MKKQFNRHFCRLSWIMTLLAMLYVFPVCKPAYAQEPWAGFFFSLQANTNSDHQIFISDFETMVKNLKTRGLNTIVFDMNYWSYHFTSDSGLNNHSYPVNRGFTPAEAHRLAEIVRKNGMQVMVALQVLTHSVGNVYPYVYPEYMLPGKNWQQGIAYKSKSDYVQYNGKTYLCVTSHTSDPGNAPPASGFWVATPSDTRDPFNKEGEDVVFKMIDELIDTFTVNGVKPEGFHIGSDELGCWYDTPEQTTGMTSAQIFAMAISNAFQHIKANNPSMEVIMWGDMLDPKWGGAVSSKNTAGATDVIPKEIIIADWRYEQTGEYDIARKTFPSVGKFIDKGFRVWPTSWANVNATTDLVWTENIEQARTGKVIGHMYSTWLFGIVPELSFLLSAPNYQVPDSILSGIGESDKPRFRGYYRGVADSINATAYLIGRKQCRGNDYFCGTYPNCADITQNDGYYGSEFRFYSCLDNHSAYSIINFPNDYVSYWQFNGNALDASGRNNGVLKNGAGFISDTEKGQVANFAGTNDYISAADNPSLNFGTGDYSVSMWIKTPFDTTPPAGYWPGIFVKGASASAYAHTWGFLQRTKSNNVIHYTQSSDSGGTSAVNLYTPPLSDGWHHVVVTRSGTIAQLYLDGIYIGQSVTAGSNLINTYPVLFGTDISRAPGNFAKFRLDDVMIFNRSLSPAEVKMIQMTTRSNDIFVTLSNNPTHEIHTRKHKKSFVLH